MVAVTGSRRLKAILVKGDRKTEVAHPEELKVFLKEKLPELKKNKGDMTTFGTAALPNLINSRGLFGTRNNTREMFDAWQDISGDLFIEQYQGKRTACHGCVIAFYLNRVPFPVTLTTRCIQRFFSPVYLSFAQTFPRLFPEVLI